MQTEGSMRQHACKVSHCCTDLRQAESAGGFVIVADRETFAISEDMSGALVRLRPGGMRQLHWHTNLDEWQYVINGTIQVVEPSIPAPYICWHGTWTVKCHQVLTLAVGKSRRMAPRSVAHLRGWSHWQAYQTDSLAQAGVFNYTGHYEESILHAGDAGFAPISSAHYFKNVGDIDCFVVLMFSAGQFTNIDATALIGNMPAEVSQQRPHCCSQLPQLCAGDPGLAGACSLILRAVSMEASLCPL